MTVTCPRCRAENRLPDILDRKAAYRCSVCKTGFGQISGTNFKKVAFFSLIAWWTAPILVWISRPMIESAQAYSLQEWIGNLFLYSPLFVLPLIILGTVLFTFQGFRHMKFTGLSPKGFGYFVLASLLGCSTCVAGIVLFARSL